MSYLEIQLLLDKFISGEDVSLSLANQLEVLIDNQFPDDDYLQETVEMLACYRPGGGDWVLSVEVLHCRLVSTKKYILSLG